MILDRLSVLTDEISDDLETALDWCVDRNIGHVEVRMVDGANAANLTDDQAKAAAEKIRKRGLTVSALASPLFKCALDPDRPVETGDLFGAKEEDIPAHFAKLERAMPIARIFGTTMIRVFSFWREKEPAKYFDEIAGHLKKAAARAAEEKLLLGLENETACNGGYAAEVADIVHRVNSPALRVMWDPGNEDYGAKTAFPEGYAHVRGLVAHCHLKDVVLEADNTPRCVPIGSGRVKLREQIQALEADGYRGLYTLETRYTPEGGTAMQGTQETLDGLKRILA